MGKIKIYLVVLFSIIIIKNSFGQDIPISISIGGAYGFATTKNSVETFVNTKMEDKAYFSENKKFSLGNGYAINGNIQYTFHKNMGFGLGFSYHFPKDVEFNEVNEVAGITAEKQRLLSAKRFTLLPALQLNTDFDKLNTYIRMGVSINFTTQKLHETIVVDTNKTQYFWEYSGESSKFGFYAQWGLSYSFNEHVSIEFNIAYEGYSYTPNKSNMVQAKFNNSNFGLDNFEEIEKSVVFEDWISDQYSQFPDADKPLSVPKQTFNYSSLSLGLTLNYHF